MNQCIRLVYAAVQSLINIDIFDTEQHRFSCHRQQCMQGGRKLFLSVLYYLAYIIYDDS